MEMCSPGPSALLGDLRALISLTAMEPEEALTWKTMEGRWLLHVPFSTNGEKLVITTGRKEEEGRE